MCPFPHLPIEIRTDSQYTISCMTTFLPNWLRNGFLTASKSTSGKSTSGGVSSGGGKEKVKNADMIKHLLVLLRRRPPSAQVRFKYVPAHTGLQGNEGADVSLACWASILADLRYWRRWAPGCRLYQRSWIGWIQMMLIRRLHHRRRSRWKWVALQLIG